MSDLNDPRVLFAAERTLLAWNRTALSLMAFGFMIERFGLFVHVLMHEHTGPMQRSLSFWIGLAFIVLGAVTSALAVVQYRRVLATLRPIEIPAGYFTRLGIYTNVTISVLGVALIGYLFHGARF